MVLVCAVLLVLFTLMLLRRYPKSVFPILLHPWRKLLQARQERRYLPNILVSERAGAGRLIVFSNEASGRFQPVEVGRTSGVVETSS